MSTIAYIAPELTALSEAFVYQELAAVEAEGYRVLPFALHRARQPAREAQPIANRTVVLLQDHPLRQLIEGLRSAWQLGARARPALRMLLGDIRRAGWRDRRSWSLSWHWLVGARMARRLADSGCRHIHAHFAGAPTQIAMYASAMSGIPFTCTAHGSDIARHALLLPEKAARARRLLAVSHHDKASLEARGVDGSKLEVVRCTTDLAPARAAASRRSSTFRIGALAPLTDAHGVDDLICAVAMLVRETARPVRLFVAGEGPERLRLQVLADQLGIGERVDFVGTLPPIDVAHWMRTLDLFAMASKPDNRGHAHGIPAALIQAMSLALPVVATRVAGTPELVRDGETGYLVQPADPDALAAALRSAMDVPERARALGRAARAHAHWEFGRQTNLRRLLKHFGPAPAQARPEPLLEEAA